MTQHAKSTCVQWELKPLGERPTHNLYLSPILTPFLRLLPPWRDHSIGPHHVLTLLSFCWLSLPKLCLFPSTHAQWGSHPSLQCLWSQHRNVTHNWNQSTLGRRLSHRLRSLRNFEHGTHSTLSRVFSTLLGMTRVDTHGWSKMLIMATLLILAGIPSLGFYLGFSPPFYFNLFLAKGLNWKERVFVLCARGTRIDTRFLQLFLFFRILRHGLGEAVISNTPTMIKHVVDHV